MGVILSLSLSLFLMNVQLPSCTLLNSETPCWADREAPVDLSLFPVAHSWSFRYLLIHVEHSSHLHLFVLIA